MKTVDFYEDQSNLEEVTRMAAEMILRGDVIVCPTDTAYGFSCAMENADSIQKITELKERQENKPYSVVMRDLAMVKQYAKVSKQQEKVLAKLLPGPVTVVLESRGKLPQEITGRTGTVGVRIPDYDLTQRIAEEVKQPYVSTSVNVSGEPPEIWGIEIVRRYEGSAVQPDLVIDAGRLADDSEEPQVSTVVDLTEEEPRVIRRGAIGTNELFEILAKIKK